MPPITQFLEPALCGFTLYALFWLWKKGASRWGSWFPALKKGMEWGLWVVALFWLFWAVSLISRDASQLQPAALALGAVLGLAAPALVTWRKGPVKEETKRGSTLADAKKVARMVKATKKQSALVLGGVPIPFDVEPYHFMVAGSTGTGKSVAISTLLDTLQARNDTVILVDSGGGFLSKYYREDTDFIFNPYDERCVGWSPTAEMSGAWDAQALARSIVPDGTGDAKEWNNYAQTFVSSVLRRLWETKRLSLRDFLYYVQVAPIKELKTLLEGTPASSQLEAEKTFGSIRTIAGNYIASYDYLPSKKDTFSVADMIRAEHSGMLFVTYRDDQLDSLRSLIGCLLDVAARTILSLEPNPHRRVWLIIDEFASIGKVQSIEQVATKARKAGGCLVLGLQSVSQLKDRYGEHGAQTILSCLSTWLVLRCSDADTADYMSKYIGEAEVQRSQKSASNSDSGGSESWSEQSTTQRVVLASEIQAYPNLEGLLKLAGDFPVCGVKLSFPAKRSENTPSFEQRDFQSNPLLKLTPSEGVKTPGLPKVDPRAPTVTEEDDDTRRHVANVAPSMRHMAAGLRAQTHGDVPYEATTDGPGQEGTVLRQPEHTNEPGAARAPTLNKIAAQDLLDAPGAIELPSSKLNRGTGSRPARLPEGQRYQERVTPAEPSATAPAATGIRADSPAAKPRVIARAKPTVTEPPPGTGDDSQRMKSAPVEPVPVPAAAQTQRPEQPERPTARKRRSTDRPKNKDLLNLLR